jgi:RimJ/RimL family protein N-acetyltransferase
MSVQYRILSSADSLAYRQIRLECLREFPHNFGTSIEEEELLQTLKYESIVASQDTDSFMAGAFFEGVLIGICGFYREGRRKTKHRGELVQLYVNKAYTNKQIGKGLLKFTVDHAFENADVEQIILSVVAGNEQAKNLYTKLGFSEYGYLSNYFKSGNRYWDQHFMILNKKP